MERNLTIIGCTVARRILMHRFLKRLCESIRDGETSAGSHPYHISRRTKPSGARSRLGSRLIARSFARDPGSPLESTTPHPHTVTTTSSTRRLRLSVLNKRDHEVARGRIERAIWPGLPSAVPGL